MKKLLLISLLALAGCATPPGPSPDAGFEAAREAADTSCAAGTPALARQQLGDKLANVRGGPASLAMLADRARANAEDKAALLQLAAQRDRCREGFAAVHDRYGHAAVGDILRASFPAVRAVYADLYNEDITFGQANQRLEQIGGKVAELVGDYGRALDARQADLAEQRRLVAIQMLQQQQLGTRPTQTNCVRYGVQVQCVSR